MEINLDAMNPEEQAIAEGLDPLKFWTAVHKKAMDGISSIGEAFKKDTARCQEFYIGALATIINNGSQELALLRIIESGIRKQTLTEELLKETLTSLDGLRAKVRTEAEQIVAPKQ